MQVMTEKREQYLYRHFGEHVQDILTARDDFFFTDFEVEAVKIPKDMKQKASELGFEPGPFFRLQIFVDGSLYWLLFRMEGDELVVGVLQGPDNAQRTPDSTDFEERVDWTDETIQNGVWEAVNFIKRDLQG